MKKLLFRWLPLLLVAMMLLTSCAELPKMKYDGESYTNPKTGISYRPAPPCYQAVSLNKDAEIARVVQKGIDDVVLYAVGDVDSSKLLTDATYELFYATDFLLPTLKQMTPSLVYITQTVELSWSVAEINNPEEIATLITVLDTQTGFPAREIDATLSKEVYDLKFLSEDYPGFYYCVTYWQFTKDVLIYEEIEDVTDFPITYPGVAVTTEEYKGDLYAVYNFGSGILYDRITKLCYPAGELVQSYIVGEE